MRYGVIRPAPDLFCVCKTLWIVKGQFVLAPRSDGSPGVERGMFCWAVTARREAWQGFARPPGDQSGRSVPSRRCALPGLPRSPPRHPRPTGVAPRRPLAPTSRPSATLAGIAPRLARNALHVWSSTWTRAIRLRATAIEDPAGGTSPCSARSRLGLSSRCRLRRPMRMQRIRRTGR